MAGGDKAAFEKVKPVLEKMGSSVVLVGPLGTGKGDPAGPQG
jgi:2-hydroxy-3-oxopropionate reductase